MINIIEKWTLYDSVLIYFYYDNIMKNYYIRFFDTNDTNCNYINIPVSFFIESISEKTMFEIKNLLNKINFKHDLNYIMKSKEYPNIKYIFKFYLPYKVPKNTDINHTNINQSSLSIIINVSDNNIYEYVFNNMGYLTDTIDQFLIIIKEIMEQIGIYYPKN